MKPSLLVQQLTEARPKRKAKPTPPADAAPEAPAPEAPASPYAEQDDTKADVMSTYEEDWRYKAIDEFNIEEKESLTLEENTSPDENGMTFDHWQIYQDEETAEAVALARVKEDLENEPELFSANFIASHVNREKLKNTLWSDVREHRSDDFDEMSDDDKAEALERAGVISDTSEAFVSRKEFLPVSEQKIAELFAEFIEHLRTTVTDKAAVAQGFQNAVQFIRSENARLSEMDDEDFIKALIADSGFPIDEDDYFTDEQSGINEETIDGFKEAYLDKLGEEFDPMEWLNDVYSPEEAQKQAIEHGGIDVEAAAQEVVNADGWAHFINHYDGNYNTLHCGAVYFRTQ